MNKNKMSLGKNDIELFIETCVFKQKKHATLM